MDKGPVDLTGQEKTMPFMGRAGRKARLRERYICSNGCTMKREYGRTPNGNAVRGRWVLRDKGGAWMDVDTYRYDLFERHKLKVVSTEKLEAGQ